MKKLFLFVFVFLIILSCQVFAADTIIKIAVLDIISRINDENLDTVTFSEMLETELLKQKYFTIVERAYLSKIIEEQKLQLSGVTDSEITRIGKLAEADKIITGSISKIDNKFILVVKVIDTSTGVIDIIEQGSADSIRGILKTIPDIAIKIVQKYQGIKETPARDNSAESSSKAAQEQSQKPKAEENQNENSGKFHHKIFPIQIAILENIQIIPKDFIITGIACNFISGYNDDIYGIQSGIIMTRSSVMMGLQAGVFYSRTEEIMYGLQTATFANYSKGHVIGAQVGLVNFADEVVGVQIGLFNSARKLIGAQIGIVNINREGYIPFMIGVNIGF